MIYNFRESEDAASNKLIHVYGYFNSVSGQYFFSQNLEYRHKRKWCYKIIGV
jgi:hypothetical protein